MSSVAHSVQHVTALKLLSAEVDRFKAEWLDDSIGLTRYDKLLAMRERESRALSSLATRLRISPQSRLDTKVAAHAAAPGRRSARRARDSMHRFRAPEPASISNQRVFALRARVGVA
jgi:hypothetical protein